MLFKRAAVGECMHVYCPSTCYQSSNYQKDSVEMISRTQESVTPAYDELLLCW